MPTGEGEIRRLFGLVAEHNAQNRLRHAILHGLLANGDVLGSVLDVILDGVQDEASIGMDVYMDTWLNLNWEYEGKMWFSGPGGTFHWLPVWINRQLSESADLMIEWDEEDAEQEGPFTPDPSETEDALAGAV